MRPSRLIPVLLLLAAPAFCGSDPFENVITKWAWAINELQSHRRESPVTYPPVNSQSSQTAPSGGHHAVKNHKAETTTTKPVDLPAPIKSTFKANTAWTGITANVIDFGTHFTVDVTTDQPANGWALKRQSTKEIVLKGSLNNQFYFQIDCPEKFVRDYGITVFIGDNSYPCFIQIFQ